MTSDPEAVGASNYDARLQAESRKWGSHLQAEASGLMLAWLDHPLVADHYSRRGLVTGEPWERWVRQALGGPAERSLDLGCGSASRSLKLWEAGSTRRIEGVDVSEDRIAEGERARVAAGAPGGFWLGDINRLELAPSSYDLIFSVHSFHHFLALEHVVNQVVRALTPRGLFVLEEFVGPTQFQWTDLQMRLASALVRTLPERFRVLPWGEVKQAEGRPTPAQVAAVSPFESIRSAEIVPLFERYFEVVEARRLGGTLQHLLYNGIAHNFWPMTTEAERLIGAIAEVEDALIDLGRLPSDFMLLVGRPRERDG